MPHIHTDDCLGVNELNELCCAHISSDKLSDAMRRTVTVTYHDNDDATVPPSHICDIHTFTDTDDDAIALARASMPNPHPYTYTVTFRDYNHELDKYAHPAVIRDVPNDVLSY